MFDIKVKEISTTTHTNDGTFLQTPFWCEFKARHGWKYKRFALEINFSEKNDNDATDDLSSDFCNQEVSVLTRSFAHNLFSIAYIPLFPKLPFPEQSADEQTIEFANLISEIAKALKAQLPSNTIAIRFDPYIDFESIEERDLFNVGMKTVAFADGLKMRKNKVDIQPPDTTLVDLTATEDEILARMHSKWRYNIRLSEKKGVVVHRYLGNDVNLSEKIDKFYELTKETNARDGNSSHAKSYYEDLIKSSAKEIENENDVPVVSLYIAEHEGEEIASIMTLFSHDEAIYLYGASSNNKRNLMPNHLLQWTAIKDAKDYGSKFYDMYGMPPEGEDENHPMHGLYMFKTNFGGKIVHRPGSYDVRLKPLAYFLYNIAETLRAFWFKKVMKKVRGR
jgi:lipid II:glycine glycyltransferase (peptidoglycan interpeptide bridge formation enzyme)